MARGRGGKPKRGGGRSFTKVDMKTGLPLESSKTPDRWREDDEDEDEDDDEEDTEEESSEESDEAGAAQDGVKSLPADLERTHLTAERDAVFGNKKPAKKPGEEDPSFQVANPNRAGNKSVKASELDKVEVKELSRREREAQQAAAAKERYWKLHQAGKTDEAKSDLARLAVIRKQREEAAASKKAETELKAKEAQSKIEARKTGRR